MTGWILFFVYMELYAAGLCVLLKRLGCPRYGLCLIPFAAFWYTDRLTDGFRLLVFPVRSWFKTVIIFCLVALAEHLQVKNATLMWPVRIAAAGMQVTPGGAMEILTLLGREEALRRLQLGLQKLAV